MVLRRAFSAISLALAAIAPARAADVLPPASGRFAAPEPAEVPDFQRHVLPLMGRIGCNTRSCHGSFQGQGGFRLSLFGYDFKADRDALLEKDSGRVDLETPEISKILAKPTLAIPHKGGKVLEEDSWAYRIFVRWIEAGALGIDTESAARFDRLEVTPTEIAFDREGQAVPLKVVAHWSDGTAEDVTCLSRFRTNDESIAEVDADGVVTSTGVGDTHVVAFYDNGVAVTPVLRPVSPRVGPDYPDVPARTEVDRRVVAKLRKLGIVPSETCTDAEFLRRASLDATGTLPTPEEVSAFLADADPDKRAKKIDELLERPTYAAWWTNKLCDITGNSPRNFQGQAGNTGMARQWYEWIYKRVAENVPYDRLIAGIVLGTSRKPGESYDDYVKRQSAYFRQKDPASYADHESMPYYWARRNVARVEDKALNFSYAFLGVRLECAQCHKHPFDQWTQDDFNQFTAFFAPITSGFAPDARPRMQEMQKELGLDKLPGGQAQRKITELAASGEVTPWREVFVNARVRPRARPQAGAGGRVATPKLLGGDEVEVERGDDPRAALMEWMRDPQNPYFARAFVNRAWANYFHRGLVDPADDLNLANPASNEDVLDYLSEGLVANGFNMKWLHREIMNSDTYQRGWQTNETNRLDERNFSRAVVRRLPAEVLLDAVAQATAATPTLASAASEVEDRAFGPKAGSGQPRRGGDYASRVFGRASRDTNCDCNRSDEPNLLQSIFLQNDGELLNAIDRRDGWVAEVRDGFKSVPAARSPEVDELAAQVQQVEKRLAAAKGNPRRAERIKARLMPLRARLAEARKAAAKPVPASLDPAAAGRLVDEAFLRTLARRPSASEAVTAGAYLTEAPDPSRGLADLLWALLNTKEFVTNH